MKTSILITTCLFMLIPFSESAAFAIDVDGWGTTRWGMTEEEVRQQYPLGDQTTTQIGLDAFTVSFKFESGQLSEVVLLPAKPIRQPESLYVRIRDELIRQYGNIQEEDNPVGTFRTATWSMRSTQVSLLMFGPNKYTVVRFHKNRSQGKTHFRGASWHMSHDQVRASESAEYIPGDTDSLLYTGEVAGLKALIVYFFVDNRLARAGYSLQETHTNRNDHLVDFGTLKDALVRKYGTPQTDEITWKNNLYRDKPSQWGLAVSVGHLVYHTYWWRDDTYIVLEMSGDNFEVDTILQYTSTQLDHLIDRYREERFRKNL